MRHRKRWTESQKADSRERYRHIAGPPKVKVPKPVKEWVDSKDDRDEVNNILNPKP